MAASVSPTSVSPDGPAVCAESTRASTDAKSPVAPRVHLCRDAAIAEPLVRGHPPPGAPNRCRSRRPSPCPADIVVADRRAVTSARCSSRRLRPPALVQPLEGGDRGSPLTRPLRRMAASVAASWRPACGAPRPASRAADQLAPGEVLTSSVLGRARDGSSTGTDRASCVPAGRGSGAAGVGLGQRVDGPAPSWARRTRSTASRPNRYRSHAASPAVTPTSPRRPPRAGPAS